MGAQIRVYRRRIRSVQSTRKITGAMQLIAGSRLGRARARLNSVRPYGDAIIRVTTTAVSQVSVDHPLMHKRTNPRRAGILVVTSDRGLAGAYSANVLRAVASLEAELHERGMETVLYVVGRKGEGYYRFRNRRVEQSWSGMTESPTGDVAREIRDTLLEAYLRGASEEGHEAAAQGGPVALDEIHVVATKFVNLLSQQVRLVKLMPLKVTEEVAPAEPQPLYDFEPDETSVLDAVLRRYVASVIALALLEAAASESASRQRAMKSATENADELIRDLTRLANEARQADITTEINEIVGGADALAAARSEFE